jgi:hypothetical protein
MGLEWSYCLVSHDRESLRNDRFGPIHLWMNLNTPNAVASMDAA